MDRSADVIDTAKNLDRGEKKVRFGKCFTDCGAIHLDSRRLDGVGDKVGVCLVDSTTAKSRPVESHPNVDQI